MRLLTFWKVFYIFGVPRRYFEKSKLANTAKECGFRKGISRDTWETRSYCYVYYFIDSL
jgi:hypothetical protein